MFKRLSREKKREYIAFILCVIVCFTFFMLPHVVYADTNPGLDDIKAQMALLQELMAALVSSVGSVVSVTRLPTISSGISSAPQPENAITITAMIK